MDILNSKRSRNVKLQSILFPNDNICSEEALYLHREEGFVLFDGYFNLFYLEKHHKYCRIEGLTLELLVSGIKKVQIMHNRDVILEQEIEVPHPSGMDRLKGKIPTLADNRRISIRLPYEEYEKGVFWFKVEVADNDKPWAVKGHYEAISGASVSDVELAIDICTYKRESYVVRNIRSLLTWMNETDIDEEKHEVAEHFKVFIVDNAKTLREYQEFDELTEVLKKNGYENLIEVIPNTNTGGAGGFTRGLEEVIKRKDKNGFTHVILMDDDATFDPDLFVRVYGVLSTLRPEYKKLTLGGSLWRQDYPFIQYAQGEWMNKLDIVNDSIGLDMRSYEKCTCYEMCTTQNELERYSGWWCCCYSLDVVGRENLPIRQMFIHRDDIEFEMRNRKSGNPVAFFSGIGVWHKAFDGEFQGAKTYYNTRNALITAAIINPELSHRYLKKRMMRMLLGNGIDNKYLKMHLIYMGVMDFLKGKEWFESLDTEKHHQNLLMYVRRLQEQYFVTNLDDPRLDPVRNEIVAFQSGMLPISQALEPKEHDPGKLSLLTKLTLNGKLLPHKKGVAVVYPYDALWEKGFRLTRYAFVQSNPDKVFFVKAKLSEVMTMIFMLVNISIKFKKSSLEQFRVKPDC